MNPFLYEQMIGGHSRRFDEYYRCYPVAMLPGPERESANHGGKVFLPASALEKLTRLHITYPMLFELINGKADKKTHAGVLEFTAEEGKIYLPYWLMQTLLLEAGDLIQVKSTDLPPGRFIKLQAQSPAFLDISDPKAVLENAFRNFSALTIGDIFSFSYNDNVYEIAVLEVKPDNTDVHAICTMETDLEVDFATPVAYKEPEPQRNHTAASSRSSSVAAARKASGTMHNTQGTMATAINYPSIAPSARTLSKGAENAAAGFTGEGHRLGSARRASKQPSRNASGTSTPQPVAGTSANQPAAALGPPAGRTAARRNGPAPLRLPKGKLFFGYEYTPPPKQREKEEEEQTGGEKPHFQGMGQTLRGKKVDGAEEARKAKAKAAAEADAAAAVDNNEGEDGGGRKLGRTQR